MASRFTLDHATIRLKSERALWSHGTLARHCGPTHLESPKPARNDRRDYKKLNATHQLSSYQVKFPVWHGDHAVRAPFSSWGCGGRCVQCHQTRPTRAVQTSKFYDSLG